MSKRRPEKNDDALLTALVANQAGEIFELDGYAAVGMEGSLMKPLSIEQTCRIPYGSELMLLPDRKPILYNLASRRYEALLENPHAPGEAIFPVAAFNSPGYVITYISAYQESEKAGYLPLFSYGAVGWHRGDFRTAVVMVDPEPRQDLRQMKREDIVAGIEAMRENLPSNRLREHLETCALRYGCPAGKNFFLGRYEAPLPTAQQCNARCLGCLSLQKDSGIPHSQDRIRFTPSSKEIAQVALAHINRVKNSVVSFGQGCEGDPLLAANVIEPAIRRIRSITPDGTINMNTNGSQPEILNRLFDAGLDSIRISLNSIREECYQAYFRPQGYRFGDVLDSIRVALTNQKFVAINYLNCPGFTDTPREMDALIKFLHRYPIHMIQWRNLNFDPVRYWDEMNSVADHSEPIGMEKMLNRIRKQFPKLKFGYFNPPKENFDE
ncbi:MAG: radical SAM protein [Desulfobacterales bacterium]|nr:radical SAM protein [Desulfobacterales bacterium]